MTIESTLYDVAQLLESADGAAVRVRRVLELLRVLVPYEQCALLEAGRGYEPRVVLVPETPLGEGTGPLLPALLELFGQLVDISPHPPTSPLAGEDHLAVPLVGLDEVIGLLFVRSSEGFTEQHLRALSVVAAALAAYVITLRDRAELTQLAGERDEARRAAQGADRAKDDVLRLLLREAKVPLAAVLACGRTLRATVDDLPACTRAIDELERAVRAQTALVEGLLDRACGGAAEPGPGDVDLPRPRAGSADDRLTGIRVLLVEHDLGVREAIEAALEHHGADVIGVGTAPRALAALERRRPDVLLFGDLPASGDSLDQLMRAVTARVCRLPAASISTRGLDDRQPAREAGFQLHLAKPIGMEALVDAVATLAGLTTTNRRRNVERGSRS